MSTRDDPTTETVLSLGAALIAMRFAPGGIERAAFVFALSLATVIAGYFTAGTAIGFIGLGILYFYRDPSREAAGDGLLSPADGRVRSITEDEDGRVRVAIFLNLWHVHVVRSSWEGRVDDRQRLRGHRRPAFLTSAVENAGVGFTFEEGGTIELRAGMFARRVRPYIDAGSPVNRGERIGHITFGSRVDVVFPQAVELDHLTVSPGERVYGGTTVVADDPSISSVNG